MLPNRQQKFPKDIPAGNYSSITPIGNDRYAVVSDKSDDGFFVFHIDIDTVSGRILSVSNEGFRASGKPNRDQEGIAYQPYTHTLFISGEADNRRRGGSCRYRHLSACSDASEGSNPCAMTRWHTGSTPLPRVLPVVTACYA